MTPIRGARAPLALLLAVLVLGASACTPAAPDLDEVAEGYVRVALQLAQHDPDLVESWRGAEGWRPGPREPVAPLLERVRSLRAGLARASARAAGDDRHRTAYLDGQLAALQIAAERLLGAAPGFDVEAREGLGLAEPFRVQTEALESIRARLDVELPGPGPLPARYAAYRARLSVNPDRVAPLMRAALEACRAVTVRAIPLPAGEGIDLVFGGASRWDGFARYLGAHRTRIEIDRGAAMDVTRALRLACHEGYPGHHVQYILIDDALVAGRGWQEFNLVPSFGPHLLVTEGAAEAGADAAFPPETRVGLYRDVLLPAAGLAPEEAERLVRVEDLVAGLAPAIAGISRAYLDHRLTHQAAVERLRDEALTPEPAALLAFAERRRARLLAYPAGRARAAAELRREGPGALSAWFTTAPFSWR